MNNINDMITEEQLFNEGWKKQVHCDGIMIEYVKRINGFFYILHHSTYSYWFEWNIHIYTPDLCNIASLEVDTLADIEQISHIYKSYDIEND